MYWRSSSDRPASGSARTRVAQRDRAEEAVPRVHHVDARQHLGGERAAADPLQDLADGRLPVDADEVRAHQAAGLGRVIAEQRPHLALVRRRQEIEHDSAALLLQLGDQVGGVVGRHARDHRGDVLVGAALDELDLVLLVELLEDVGFELEVVLADRLDDLLALAVGGGLDQVGDLGRVKLRQPGVEDPQADRGRRLRRTARRWPSRGTPRSRSCARAAGAGAGAARRAGRCRRRRPATSPPPGPARPRWLAPAGPPRR